MYVSSVKWHDATNLILSSMGALLEWADGVLGLRSSDEMTNRARNEGPAIVTPSAIHELDGQSQRPPGDTARVVCAVIAKRDTTRPQCTLYYTCVTSQCSVYFQHLYIYFVRLFLDKRKSCSYVDTEASYRTS